MKQFPLPVILKVIVSGTTLVIYDYSKRGLSNALADVQHKYSHLIKSSVHIHLDHDNCFEVIVLMETVEKLKNL